MVTLPNKYFNTEINELDFQEIIYVKIHPVAATVYFDQLFQIIQDLTDPEDQEMGNSYEPLNVLLNNQLLLTAITNILESGLISYYGLLEFKELLLNIFHLLDQETSILIKGWLNIIDSLI